MSIRLQVVMRVIQREGVTSSLIAQRDRGSPTPLGDSSHRSPVQLHTGHMRLSKAGR